MKFKKVEEVERLPKKYSPSEVFEWYNSSVASYNGKHEMSDKKYKTMFDGHLIKVYSLRYFTFIKSLTCCTCGITRLYFYKERTDLNSGYHLNLYGCDSNGDEVLMTKDHIIPVTKSGKNHTSNLQTMCTNCNRIKDSMLPHEYEAFILAK